MKYAAKLSPTYAIEYACDKKNGQFRCSIYSSVIFQKKLSTSIYIQQTGQTKDTLSLIT